MHPELWTKSWLNKFNDGYIMTKSDLKQQTYIEMFLHVHWVMGGRIVEYLEGNSSSNFRVWHRSPHIQCMSCSLLKFTMQQRAVFKSCEKEAIRTCSRSNFKNNVSAFEPRLLHDRLYQKWVLQDMLSLAFLELNPLKPLLRGSPFALRLPTRHGCVVPPCVYSLEAKIKKLKKFKNKLVMISDGQPHWLPLCNSQA